MTNENKPKSNRWGVLLALPLAGALTIPAATAFAGAGFHRGGGDMAEFAQFRMQKRLDAVGASDAQKAQIKQTWENLKPQLKAVREDRMKVRQDLKKALTATTVDPGAVEKLRKQSLALEDKASALITQGMVASANVLTPDQRQKLATDLEQHKGFRHHGE